MIAEPYEAAAAADAAAPAREAGVVDSIAAEDIGEISRHER